MFSSSFFFSSYFSCAASRSPGKVGAEGEGEGGRERGRVGEGRREEGKEGGRGREGGRKGRKEGKEGGCYATYMCLTSLLPLSIHHA